MDEALEMDLSVLGISSRVFIASTHGSKTQRLWKLSILPPAKNPWSDQRSLVLFPSTPLRMRRLVVVSYVSLEKLFTT